MLEALEQIKNEMGSDALIVSARQVPGGPSWQVWKKAVVEVVAVKPEKPDAEGEKTTEQPHLPTAEKMEAGEPIKKTDTSAVKTREKSSKPAQEKTAATSQSDDVESLEERIEDTSPVKINVKKAVFPELSKEKAAPPAVQQNEGDPANGKASPVELMEQMGIISADAESLAEIDILAASPVLPAVEPQQMLEVIHEEPAKPAISVEKFSELIASRQNTRSEDMWPLLAKLHMQLKNQGLDEEILDRITEISLEMVSSKGMNDEKRIRESLARQMEAHIHIQKESENTRQIICLTGASGAGKTCLCAKLAVKYHTSMKKQIAWISADTVRTGAIHEAKTYADAIGIPMHAAYTPEELYEAVAREKNADVILVDMPSVNPRSEASVVESGAFLTILQQRNTWIVAPATAKTADMENLAAALLPFRPTAIALTKLDETGTFGSVFNLAWKTQLPLVYYSFGPRVTDELIPARADTLVRAMFTERFDG
jgi:flagellar biosynthesis protein FlhF